MPCPGVTRQCALLLHPSACHPAVLCPIMPGAQCYAMLMPVSAGLPAPPSSSRKFCCDALNTLPGTLVGARSTTPFGSSSVLSPWPITCQNRTIVSSTPVLGSEHPHQTSFPSLEPAQRRSCSWLPISAPLVLIHAHATVLFLHYSLSHLDKLPTHLTIQVPGSRRRLVLKRRPSPTIQLTGILRHQTPCSRCKLRRCQCH